MNKKIIVLIGLAFITNMSLCDEFKEGLQSGKGASQREPFSQNVPEMMQNTEMQAILNQPISQEGGLDPSALSSSTANHAIESSKNFKCKDLNQQLLKHSQQLKEQAVQVEDVGINAVALKPEQIQEKALTPNQIINQNLLQMETFPNVRSSATEPAFSAVESQDNGEEREFINKEDFAVSIQEEYVAHPTEETVIEPYEMGCSTTLLDNLFEREEVLDIQIKEASPPGTKRITANFMANGFNQSTFSINFKTGTIHSPQGGMRTKTFSDTLGEDYGPNTTVKLISQNNSGEGGVRYILYQHPSFSNGFVAGFDAFQPKTGRKHKENEWRDRGGQLIYEFSDLTLRQPSIVSERWLKNNETLEELVSLGECAIIKIECVEGKESRLFGTRAPFLTISRDCWKKRIHYQCQVPEGANDCGSLPKDCQKVGSEFIDFLGQHAVEIHHFNCQRALIKKESVLKNRGSKFAPSGEYAKNNDMGEAITGLNIAKEIASGFRGEAKGIAGCFFGGKAMECTRRPKDCCSNKKGFWRKMTGCRETEQQLAHNITAGNCHEVGEYRVKKSVLQKIGHVDKKGYCCFQSKLARIIQIGARQQLSLDWGLPETPDCRALTLAEIQKINWSLIDFSEIAKDFIEKAKTHTLSTHAITAIQNQLRTTLQKSVTELKTQYPRTPLGEKQQQESLKLQETIQKEDNKRRLRGTTQ